MSDFRLQVFYCAARTLNFNQAAKDLFITQPAVSKHIKSLEEHYHVRLFERLGPRLQLTAAGQAMLRHCEKLIADYEGLTYEMSLFNQETAGRLRLGASTTIAQYVLPELLASFTQLYPEIEISLINGNSRFIEHAVRNHEIELGLVEGVFKSAGLNYQPFMADRLQLIARRGAPLPPAITLDELRTLPLVLREHGSGTLDVIAKTLAEFSLKLPQLKVRMYLGSTEGIKLFLRHSDCIGIVSAFAVRDEISCRLLQRLELTGVDFRRSFNLVQAPGPQSPLLERFKAWLLQAAAHDNFKLS